MSKSLISLFKAPELGRCAKVGAAAFARHLSKRSARAHCRAHVCVGGSGEGSALGADTAHAEHACGAAVGVAAGLRAGKARERRVLRTLTQQRGALRHDIVIDLLATKSELESTMWPTLGPQHPAKSWRQTTPAVAQLNNARLPSAAAPRRPR